MDPNSPISARNDNIYGHRRLVEQGKLTDDGLEAVGGPAPRSNDVTPTGTYLDKATLFVSRPGCLITG